jgi:hypothetical protein
MDAMDKAAQLVRPPIYTAEDVARVFDRSSRRVRQWAVEGKGTPSVPRANGRGCLYSEDDVQEIAEATGLPLHRERLGGGR